MRTAKFLGRVAAFCLAAAAAGPAAAQPGAAPGGAIAPAEATDLEVVAEQFVLTGAFSGILEQAMMRLRFKQLNDPEWQKLERDYPGVGEVRIAAAGAAARAELPALQSRMREAATAYWAEHTTPGERALIAGYLRTSYPQRMMHIRIEPRADESATQAVERADRALEASKTAEEVRREEAFYASAVGRKYNGLAQTYLATLQQKHGELAGELIKRAIAEGNSASQAFVDRRDGHGK